MSEPSKYPPPDQVPRNRIFANIIDEIANDDPNRALIFVPRSKEPRDGWKPITYKETSNAANYLAHEIDQRIKVLNLRQDAFPTIAYIGPSDARYLIFMLACIKASCKAFFISPRNSLEGQLALFEAMDCRTLYYADSYESLVQPWLEKRPMEAVMAPSQEVWLNSKPDPYPYDRTFDQARWDPVYVMHTSGSTGIPKPIVVKQGIFVVADTLQSLSDYLEAPSMWAHWASYAQKTFLPMPLFHAAGLAPLSTLAIVDGVPVALSIPDRPLGAELVIDCLAHSGSDATLLPPSMVEEIASTEEGIAALKKLKFLGFAGGNLSQVIGTQLKDEGVALNNVISSTEYFPYPIQHQSDPELWQYFIFNSKVMGADWRPVPFEQGIYELFVKRKVAEEPGMQSVFYTFPHLAEWSTGDLFRPHPTLPDHWLYHGRADDVVVFSNGEKLNPTTIEEAIAGHPAINAALVVGQDRFQPALILEPAQPPEDDAMAEALIEQLWPLIEKVNKKTVAHGRIIRQLVAVADKDMPFLRASKGTVQRGPTVRLYGEYVEALYERVETSGDTEEIVLLELSSAETLARSIVALFTTKVGCGSLHLDTDFFSAGVDSMQVIGASRQLRSSFAAADVSINPDVISTRVIYANPTPRRLADYVFASTAKRNEASGRNGRTDELETRELISKYTAHLPLPNTNQLSPLDEGQTILLTGTTGSLGAYMLHQLCSSPRVANIVALNRGSDGGQSRQPAICATRGLTADFSRVEFLAVDLSLPNLGLSSKKYEELLLKADRVIHNAWPVNFNMSLSSFEPYISGVRHLVDFAHAARKRVPIVFLSSIGTADGWTAKEAVPEAALDDLTLPCMGYGRSKLAGSLILDAAAERSGVPGVSVRVGQIAGSRAREGVWNRQEFLPSLIASSVYLGALPRHLGAQNVVDWLPIEDVAGLILDITGVTATVCPSSMSGYFHGVNPTPASWDELAQVVEDYYHGRIKKLVSLEEWVKMLEDSASQVDQIGTDVYKNPAIKLLDTYQGMLSGYEQGSGHVEFSMTRTVAHSPTIARLGPITADLMRNWCEQWGI